MVMFRPAPALRSGTGRAKCQPMDDNVSEQVYVLEKFSSGAYELVDDFPISTMLGTLPSIGDRLTLDLYDDDKGDGIAVAKVVGRHFVRYIMEKTGDECYAWFLLVETIETDEAVGLADAFGKVFRREFRNLLWTSKSSPPIYEPVPPLNLPKSKRISHKMKDPAYWTPERKEAMRKKRDARLARMARLSGPGEAD